MKIPRLILPFPLAIPRYRSLNSAFVLMLVLALSIAQLAGCNQAPDPKATGANPPTTQAGQPTTAEQPAAVDQATMAGQGIPVGPSSTTEQPAALGQTTAAGQPNASGQTTATSIKEVTDEVAAADTRTKQQSGAPIPLNEHATLADPSLLGKQAAVGVVAATAIAPRAEFDRALLPPPPLPLPPLTP